MKVLNRYALYAHKSLHPRFPSFFIFFCHFFNCHKSIHPSFHTLTGIQQGACTDFEAELNPELFSLNKPWTRIHQGACKDFKADPKTPSYVAQNYGYLN